MDGWYGEVEAKSGWGQETHTSKMPSHTARLNCHFHIHMGTTTNNHYNSKLLQEYLPSKGDN